MQIWHSSVWISNSHDLLLIPWRNSLEQCAYPALWRRFAGSGTMVFPQLFRYGTGPVSDGAFHRCCAGRTGTERYLLARPSRRHSVCPGDAGCYGAGPVSGPVGPAKDPGPQFGLVDEPIPSLLCDCPECTPGRGGRMDLAGLFLFRFGGGGTVAADCLRLEPDPPPFHANNCIVLSGCRWRHSIAGRVSFYRRL